MKMFLKDPEASKALSESDRPTNIYAICSLLSAPPLCPLWLILHAAA